jgi:NTP pyrophosphatase (non-canonical NTP hydrolase)
MLRILQQQVRDWAKQNFGDVPTWMPLMGAMEELGELSHAHLKEAQGIRLQENHPEKAKDAIGDIIIYLAHYCSVRRFDLEDIVNETWAGVSKRDWKKDSSTGHIKFEQKHSPLFQE